MELSRLDSARDLGQAGRFTEMLAVCRDVARTHDSDVEMLLRVGDLLLSNGFLNQARACYQRARLIQPGDLRAAGNLANVARESGDPRECRRLYGWLVDRLPDNPVVRRNALTCLEYDPAATDAERLAAARAWGDWATALAGGPRPRPTRRPEDGRLLRIGYVSADFCHHTVGLFVKNVLASHDRTRVAPYGYSAGTVNDWVTAAIGEVCQLRQVTGLTDHALAALIRQDQIDVLVDLSGHTAGSRLTVFTHRPAPVQVSWLGYFATTGLPCIDGVLLDDWHAPPGSEDQFVEPVIRLPQGRLCYRPVPFAPPVSPPPCLARGHVTFGSFNNTAKLNPAVLDLWARILAAVPDSRLVLKWRTFNDQALRRSVWEGFAARGIEQERIELRGPSLHAGMLEEYADIDIALDPFPFTGGLTSCEALWMGAPVVTWPQSRAVSRQGFALLSAIGLPELAARDADDYVRIAVELAHDPARLTALRRALRGRMAGSPLMDVPGFTRGLEQCLDALYHDVMTGRSEGPMTAKTVLHVGAGHPRGGAALPPAFRGPGWREVRLDIDPANQPDILGSMLDMAAVASGSVDALYSAHNIEHVFAHEVPVALAEFLRVLKSDGYAVITCPDLQAVAALVAEDKLTQPAYQSPAGPITPHDILFGHGAALAAGQGYMAHKCGFTLSSLTAALQAAGFQTVAGLRRPQAFDLWVVASKSPTAEADIRALAGQVFPR